MNNPSNAPKRAPLPYVLGGLALGAGIIALAAALPSGLAWGFLHPPRRLYRQTPRSALGLPFETFRVTAGDGVRINGWFVPAPQKPHGVVVVCHGYYGNRATMLPYLSFLHRAGFAAILFDFRGHGWSGGAMTTFGIAETLDLAAVLDWTETHANLAESPVGVLGESMGGAVALLVGAHDARVGAIVTDSTFARFDYAVEGRLKLAFGPRLSRHITPSTQRAGERLLGRPSHRISPADAARRFAPRPLLAIHGASDRLIEPVNARRLADAAGETATVWEVPRAPHVSSVLVEGEEYARRVGEFFANALTPLFSPPGAS